MCVGLSAKVVRISDGTAVVDAGGAKREVSSELLEDLEPGDYVMVHAGVAIAKSGYLLWKRSYCGYLWNAGLRIPDRTLL